MGALDAWLAQRGAVLAGALESRREPICAEVASRLAAAFPALCYDPTRPDALLFQRQTFHETPRRFHRLLQVLLYFRMLIVIEREYRWGWAILQNYGVERLHLLAQVRFYFDSVRANVVLSDEDAVHLDLLEAAILEIIEHVTEPALTARSNGCIHGNGVHPPGS